MKKLIFFVLDQVHGAPLLKNKGLKKLECFSKKRFKELKAMVKEIKDVVIAYSLKKKKKPKRNRGKKGEFLNDIELQRDICIEYKGRKKDKYPMSIDSEKKL